MARPLSFLHRGAELTLAMERLDRSKLYGTVDIEALDEHGQRCELANLASDGRTLIGKGGTALGFVSPEKEWLDRAELRPVGPTGAELVPVPSSFKESIPLDRTATVDEYLAHNIKSVYLLEGDGLGPLQRELATGVIYAFPFSYRGGLVADVGFLLAGQDDAPFLAIGQPTHLHFIGLEQPPAYEDEETGGEPEGEELDFGMM